MASESTSGLGAGRAVAVAVAEGADWLDVFVVC